MKSKGRAVISQVQRFRVGFLTIREPGVRLLAGGITDEIHGPSKALCQYVSKVDFGTHASLKTYELGNEIQERTNRRVAEGLLELCLDVGRDLGSLEVLLLGVERRETESFAGLGYEDLVASQVRGLSVVLGVLEVHKSAIVR